MTGAGAARLRRFIFEANSKHEFRSTKQTDNDETAIAKQPGAPPFHSFIFVVLNLFRASDSRFEFLLTG
jgi:hypothetical protein